MKATSFRGPLKSHKNLVSRNSIRVSRERFFLNLI